MKTEPSEEEEEEEKKKKNPSEEDRTSEKEEEKKKVSWPKVTAEWVPHVCLITKMTLNYEL